MFSKSKDMITKAINSGINMKFMEFIKFNNIKLENIIVDSFYHNLSNNLPIYMSDSLISYFGYGGSNKTQKKRINELIDNNFIENINHKYWIYNNDEYIKFLDNNQKLIDGRISALGIISRS